MNKTLPVCEKCGETFTPKSQHASRHPKYCSSKCYLAARWPGGVCKSCGKKCTHTYCNRKCLDDYWNKHDFQLRKKPRQWKQKLEIMAGLGGKCVKCGNADLRVLDINHIKREEKTKFACYTMQRRLRDWKNNMSNLELLCANCHRIHTCSQMGYYLSSSRTS